MYFYEDAATQTKHEPILFYLIMLPQNYGQTWFSHNFKIITEAFLLFTNYHDYHMIIQKLIPCQKGF